MTVLTLGLISGMLTKVIIEAVRDWRYRQQHTRVMDEWLRLKDVQYPRWKP